MRSNAPVRVRYELLRSMRRLPAYIPFTFAIPSMDSSHA